MVNNQPLNKTFDKVVKELQDGVNLAMLRLQEGMQAYLSNTINTSQLYKIIEGMGIPNIANLLQGNIPGFDPYRILGLDKTASNDEVKKRYLKIMAKIHPDISGEEMTFLTALVNDAYSMIRKERGI